MSKGHRLSSEMEIDVDPTGVSGRYEGNILGHRSPFEYESSLPSDISISEDRLCHNLVLQYNSPSSVNVDDTIDDENDDQHSEIVHMADQGESEHDYDQVKERVNESNTELYSGCSAREPSNLKSQGINWSHVNLFMNTVTSMTATLEGVQIDREFGEEVDKDKVFDDAEYELTPQTRTIYFVNNLKTDRRADEPEEITAEDDMADDQTHLPPKKRTHLPVSSIVSAGSSKKIGVKDKSKGISKQSSRSKATVVTPPVRPFRCHICPSSFDRGGHLRVHIGAVHEKKRPFKCEDCDARFGHSSSLQRHGRTVHNKTSDKALKRLGNNSSQQEVGHFHATPDSLHTKPASVRGGKPKPHRCRRCRASFSCISMLIRHKNQKHIGESDTSDDEIRAQDNATENEDVMAFW